MFGHWSVVHFFAFAGPRFWTDPVVHEGFARYDDRTGGSGYSISSSQTMEVMQGRRRCNAQELRVVLARILGIDELEHLAEVCLLFFILSFAGFGFGASCFGAAFGAASRFDMTKIALFAFGTCSLLCPESADFSFLLLRLRLYDLCDVDRGGVQEG